MKKLTFILSLFIVVIATSCYRVAPDAGQEAVLVSKPYFFGSGGVLPDVVKTGSEFVAVSTDFKLFQVTPITITEEFLDMITRGNNPVSFNAYMKIQCVSGKTPILYEKFSEKWYENSLQAQFRTIVRDEANKYEMFELAANREILASVEMKIFEKMSNLIKSISIPVKLLNITIGAVTPPPAVLDETKKTAAETQRSKTQDQRKIAEDSRKAAEESKAKADQAYKNQMNMTNNEYLHLRSIEVEKEKVELINEHKNVTVIFNSGQPGNLSIPLK